MVGKGNALRWHSILEQNLTRDENNLKPGRAQTGHNLPHDRSLSVFASDQAKNYWWDINQQRKKIQTEAARKKFLNNKRNKGQ